MGFINQIKAMNLPNKLTLLRIVMVPFFVLFLLLPGTAVKIIALILFIAASLTDTADGYIARKYDLVTDFGKFMDPLADKLLVCSALICMIQLNKIACWIVIIIIAREFIISGFRLIAADNGIVIAASWWGKSKTICQMVMIPVLILDICTSEGVAWLHILGIILVWASLVLTVVSLVDYIAKNKEVLGTER